MKRLFKKYLIISVACSLPFFCGEPTAMAQENNADNARILAHFRIPALT